MRNQNQPVAVEGYPFIALSAFVTLVFAVLGWSFLTLLFLGLTLFIIYFFRNPERLVPQEEGLIVAPADGKVVFVGSVEKAPILDAPALKISIFMSVFNVHVNRAPCSGKIVDMYYHKGSFLNAALDKASEQNEQAGLLIETEAGQNVVCVQIAGLIARRIVTYPMIGDLLERGCRYGLIRFGSRVDVYLPAGTEPEVVLGQLTVAGETSLGRLS